MRLLIHTGDAPGPAGSGETTEWALPALTAFFRHRLPRSRHHEVEDFVQETVLAFWIAVSGRKRRFVHDPAAYLLSIARHKALDALRREYRRRESPIEDVPPELLDRFTTVEAAHDALERSIADRLARALQRLQPIERDVLTLRFIEEVSNAAACRQLGIPPDEGSRIKYRALAKLRLGLARSGALPSVLEGLD
jgi:RNA polymerase sigma-70 factor (ECF subfamily)